MALNPFPFYTQLDQRDCGPTCLKIIAKYFGKTISIELLRRSASLNKDGVSLNGLSEASESIGLHPLAVRASYSTLVNEAPLPCVAHWAQRHFVVVYKIKKDVVYVSDPAHGLLKYSKKDFLAGWIGNQANEITTEGYLLLVEPTPAFYEDRLEQKEKLSYRFLLWNFRPYRKYIFQLFLGLAFGSLLQLIFPFLTQSVVDYGINYQNMSFVYLILFAQIFLFISQSTVDFIRGWILLHMTSRVNIGLISDFLLKLMRLPIAFFDSKNTGDILQRIYDHNRIQNFLSGTTLNTLFSVFNVLIMGSVLCYYNTGIFMIFLSGSILYMGWTLLFLKKRAELDYRRFGQSSENQNSLFQLISGMQEIKLNGSERRRRWEWEAIQVRLFKVSMQSLSLSQTQSMGSSFLHQFQNILITFISVKSVIAGELTLGMMLSVQYIIGQLNAPVNSFIGFIQAAQDAKISLDRLSEIHNKENEEGNHEEMVHDLPENKSIRLEKVSFRYGEKTTPWVLDNVDIEIPEGKVTAIVGSSGSGKTTLLKLLLKFYEPAAGTIAIGNTRLKNISAKSWRKACGTVMQDGFIFDDTIARNITESDTEGPREKERLRHAVSVANIGEFIEGQPSGYQTRIGAKGVNLSTGQRQRVLIARAVYKNPSYIFFDEATSALDSNNERVIMDNLREFYAGKTVVVVAHRLSTVRNADQIIVLEKGKIIERGNHLRLVKEKGAYYTLVKNQLELAN